MVDKLNIPLPWQSLAWDALIARHRAGNMPHALLLSGHRGLGKSLFARALAEALLCEAPQPTGQACGQCRSCQQMAAHSHPDFKAIEPEEGKRIISIDQCRSLGEFMTLTSHYGRYRLVLLQPAEQMNVAAANSLLKTLEEPPAGSLLILVTDQPYALLPTIRSRCQQLAMQAPEREQAKSWLSQQLDESEERLELLLSLSDDAPLQALSLTEGEELQQRAEMLADLYALLQGQGTDLLAIAKRWSEQELAEVVNTLQGWFADMLRLKASNRPPLLSNPDIAEELRQLAEKSSWELLYGQIERLNEIKKRLNGSLNAQLLMEDFLIGWYTSMQRVA